MEAKCKQFRKRNAILTCLQSTDVHPSAEKLHEMLQADHPTVEYYPKCTANTNSFVDALKSIGVDSSLANRKKIAQKNGISEYKGTATQNSTLLKKLKAGTLIK